MIAGLGREEVFRPRGEDATRHLVQNITVNHLTYKLQFAIIGL